MPHSKLVKLLRYIELKSGYSNDDGPAWIGYVTPSKTGRTLYFNGRGLMKLKGQRRGDSGGNYVDVENGDSFWVSGVKKNCQDRHWAGSGKVQVEAAAIPDYLKAIIARLSKLANATGRGWSDDPTEESQFTRNVTSSGE